MLPDMSHVWSCDECAVGGDPGGGGGIAKVTRDFFRGESESELEVLSLGDFNRDL